jgi:NAD(P)-dependent dehydrogenase (short-subunit alcohol dehydrogenase family)
MNPVCLVTGAGGKLGQALCRSLGDRYDIIATYRSTLPAISSQIKRRIYPASDHRPIFCIQADLAKRDDIRRLVEVAMARHGRIDSIINSAADTSFHGKLLEIWKSNSYADSQLHLNCIAPMNLASAVHQECWKDHLEDNGRWNRSVVNISSMSGLYAYHDQGQAFYSASKAALNMLTLYLSLELAPYSVRANAICPGRLTDPTSIQSVVAAVQNLLTGADTGMIISEL